jgi:hypothetical protein
MNIGEFKNAIIINEIKRHPHFDNFFIIIII